MKTEIIEYTSSLLDLFNNREKAILVWTAIFIIWALSQKNVRKSFYSLLDVFFGRQILTLFALKLLYIGLIVFLLYRIQLWNVLLMKDTIYWFFGTAMAFSININKIKEDEDNFKKMLWNCIKFLLILEFILKFYTFNLVVELLLVPFVTTIIVMKAFIEVKQEYLQVQKLLNPILVFIGVVLVVFTIYNLIVDYRVLVTINNLRAFLLPPLLTIAFIPFLYCFALFLSYEVLFLRIKFALKDDELAIVVKRRIFISCLFNLRKLNRLAKDITQDIWILKDERILKVIEDFK